MKTRVGIMKYLKMKIESFRAEHSLRSCLSARDCISFLCKFEQEINRKLFELKPSCNVVVRRCILKDTLVVVAVTRQTPKYKCTFNRL